MGISSSLIIYEFDDQYRPIEYCLKKSCARFVYANSMDSIAVSTYCKLYVADA